MELLFFQYDVIVTPIDSHDAESTNNFTLISFLKGQFWNSVTPFVGKEGPSSFVSEKMIKKMDINTTFLVELPLGTTMIFMTCSRKSCMSNYVTFFHCYILFQ